MQLGGLMIAKRTMEICKQFVVETATLLVYFVINTSMKVTYCIFQQICILNMNVISMCRIFTKFE